MKNQKMESKHFWNKFGDAKSSTIANKSLTKVSTEEVFLELPNVIDSAIKGSDEMKSRRDFLAQRGQNCGAHPNILCRNCQGHHRTENCHWKKRTPFQDNSTYIPPRQKYSFQRMINSGTTRRSSENLVRVSNFSRDADADDLRDFFIPFGALTSVFLAVDRHTRLSKGFGFVSFVNKDDAQRAIDSLHRYGYESLILHVEWFDQY